MKELLASVSTYKYLFLIIVLCLVIRVIPAFVFYGTGDVSSAYKQTQQLMKGENLYVRSTYNYYPDIMFFLYLNGIVQKKYNIPYQFLVKLPTIIADLGITVLIFVIVKKHTKNMHAALMSSLLFALNPVSIIISGFHGQYDSPVLLCILFALLLYELFPWEKSQIFILFFVILGITLKIWGGVIIPLLLIRLKEKKQVIYFILYVFCIMLLITVLTTHVYSIQFIKRVFLYKPPPDYGLGALFEHFPAFFHRGPGIFLYRACTVFHGLFAIILALFFIIFSLIRGRKWDVYNALTLVFITIYVTSLGLGSQYLTWIIPFALIARDRMVILYSLISSFAIIAFYVDRYQEAFRPTLFSSIIVAGHFPISYGKMIIILWIFCIIWMVKKMRDI